MFCSGASVEQDNKMQNRAKQCRILCLYMLIKHIGVLLLCILQRCVFCSRFKIQIQKAEVHNQPMIMELGIETSRNFQEFLSQSQFVTDHYYTTSQNVNPQIVALDKFCKHKHKRRYNNTGCQISQLFTYLFLKPYLSVYHIVLCVIHYYVKKFGVSGRELEQHSKRTSM